MALVQTDTVASGTDSDGDAIPDAWELIHVSNLTRLSATTDQDADGATDADEYLADTSPLDPEDTLRIQRLGFDPTGTHLLITWPTRPTRSYWIRTREGLDPPTPWIDSGLGRLYPDSDTMTRILPADHAAYRYFRNEAMRPLTPGSPAAP